MQRSSWVTLDFSCFIDASYHQGTGFDREGHPQAGRGDPGGMPCVCGHLPPPPRLCLWLVLAECSFSKMFIAQFSPSLYVLSPIP